MEDHVCMELVKAWGATGSEPCRDGAGWDNYPAAQCIGSRCAHWRIVGYVKEELRGHCGLSGMQDLRFAMPDPAKEA